MKRRLLASLSIAVAGAIIGCNAVLGLGDYNIGGGADASDDRTTGGPDAPVVDAPIDDAVEGDGGCDASLPTSPDQCFACTPTTTPQFLNACTTSACVPFDDKTRLKNWDGGELPTVPDPIDGGAG